MIPFQSKARQVAAGDAARQVPKELFHTFAKPLAWELLHGTLWKVGLCPHLLRPAPVMRPLAVRYAEAKVTTEVSVGRFRCV